MADRYCDHGVYGAAVFAGYISNTANNDNGVAGDKLTVTSVTSGFLNVGAMLSGGDIPVGTVIKSFVSGTLGAAGVYTVCVAPSSGASVIVRATSGLSSTGALPLNTILSSLWGKPQEGDGLASTPSTSAAIVSINLAAATAAAGAVFSIMGSTLTCVTSGAGVNQFNAGSGATLVSNLVAAINRTTNTTLVVAQDVNWNTPKVQDAVFARIGSPTTTLQIMTRAGSAVYNSSQVLTSGFTGGTFGPYTFSGGVSGCWGILVNIGFSIFPSAISNCSYSFTQGKQLAGTCIDVSGAGHTTYIRSGKQLYGYSGNSSFINISVSGTPSAPTRFIIDDSSIWPDGLYPQLSYLGYPITSSGTDVIKTSVSTGTHFKATVYPDGSYGFKFYGVPPMTSVASINIGVVPGAIIEGVELDSYTYGNTGAQIVFSYSGGTSVGAASLIKNCRLRSKADVPFFNSSSSNSTFECINIVCDGNGMAAPMTRAVNFSSINSSGAEFSFENIQFKNIPVTSKLVAPTDLWVYPSATFSNTTWGGIIGKGPAINPISWSKNSRFIQSFQSHGNRDFHFDSNSIYYEWDSQAGYPTCNALLQDGITPWSIKVILPRNVLWATRSTSGELPRFVKLTPPSSTLAEDVRTLTVEMAIEETLTLTKQDVFLQVSYIDTSGNVVSIDSYDPSAGALSVSTTTWSSESGGQVIFNPGHIAHDKKKLTIVTPSAVKENTEISIHLRFTTTVPDIGRTIFVDPEVLVT